MYGRIHCLVVVLLLLKCSCREGDELKGHERYAVAEEERNDGGDAGHAQPAAQSLHDEDKDKETKASKMVATALALSLFGSVMWIMFIFYFVNSDDPNIRQTTWKVLQAMITIFCSVLMFTSLRDISVSYFGESAGDQVGPPDWRSRLSAIIRFCCLYIGLRLLLFALMTRPEAMKRVGLLGGHIVGFSAIEVFASILQEPTIAESVLFCVLAVAVTFLIMQSFQVVTYYFRKCMQRESPVHDAEIEWKETCAEAEDESLSISLGMLVSMVVRRAIMGHMPALHAIPRVTKANEVWYLFGAAALFAVALFFAAMIGDWARTKKLSGYSRSESYCFRITLVFENIFSMCMGWCLLFWGEHLYWYSAPDSLDDSLGSVGRKTPGVGSQMTARMIQAILFSGFVFFSIHIIDHICDNLEEKAGTEMAGHKAAIAEEAIAKALRQVLDTFGLLMGLSWEAAFDTAVDGIGLNFEDAQLRFIVTLSLTAILCAVVLPAWALYLVDRHKDPALVAYRHQNSADRQSTKEKSNSNAKVSPYEKLTITNELVAQDE